MATAPTRRAVASNATLPSSLSTHQHAIILFHAFCEAPGLYADLPAWSSDRVCRRRPQQCNSRSCQRGPGADRLMWRAASSTQVMPPLHAAPCLRRRHDSCRSIPPRLPHHRCSKPSGASGKPASAVSQQFALAARISAFTRGDWLHEGIRADCASCHSLAACPRSPPPLSHLRASS